MEFIVEICGRAMAFGYSACLIWDILDICGGQCK